ncbi:MAG: TetR/AcrR family transcriptional regulator [Novosphingobium sp.]|nr:TetR/AcrR family transcriptional regulator [Novosphingobium sp.]
MASAKDDIPARDRLLAVATRLFTEHGYEGTPVSRIVREAGVTMPVLYYHFGNKSDLLGAVIAARGSWFRSDLAIDPARPFSENCRALVGQALDHVEEVRDGLRLRLLLGFEAGPDAGKLRDLVHEQRQRSIASLAARMGEALPDASPRRLAWLAEVFLSGVQAMALDLIGVNRPGRFLDAKAVNLVGTLVAVAALPEGDLPDVLI